MTTVLPAPTSPPPLPANDTNSTKASTHTVMVHAPLESFLNDCLNINFIWDALKKYRQEQAKTSSSAKRNSALDAGTIRRLRRKREAIIQQGGKYAYGLAKAFESQPEEDEAAIIQAVRDYCFDLYIKWCQACKELMEDTVVKLSIVPTLQAVFMSITYFFTLIEPKLRAALCIQVIEALSYLEFSRVVFPQYATMVRGCLNKMLEAPNSTELLRTLCDTLVPPNRSLPETAINYPPALPRNAAMAHLPELGQLHLFIAVVELLFSRLPEDVIRNKVLPLLFQLLDHPNISFNSSIHRCFRILFLQPSSYQQRAVPYYWKRALQNYPAFTSIQSIYDSFRGMLRGQPPSSPLILYTFRQLLHRLRELVLVLTDDEIKTLTATPQPNPSLPTSKQHSNSDSALATAVQKQIPQTAERLHAVVAFAGMVLPLPLVVDLKLLDPCLEAVAELLAMPEMAPELRILLLKLVHAAIARSFDYTRKDTCLKWYLSLIRRLGLHGDTIDRDIRVIVSRLLRRGAHTDRKAKL